MKKIVFIFLIILLLIITGCSTEKTDSTEQKPIEEPLPEMNLEVEKESEKNEEIPKISEEITAPVLEEPVKEDTYTEPEETAAPDGIIEETTIGDDPSEGWYIDDDGCMHITGAISGVPWESEGIPWISENDRIPIKIKSVVAEPGSSIDTGKELFAWCDEMVSADLSCLDMSKVTDMTGMFSYCFKLTELDLSNCDTSNVTDMGYMFSWCVSLTELNLSGIDTSNVKSMFYMFEKCRSLTELDLSSFDTSSVENMNFMFCECENLTELNLSGFDTSNVKRMEGMFEECKSLKSLDLSSFDTSNVTDMLYMFVNCESLTELDLSNFNTKNVEDGRMGIMFSGCINLKYLDISSFETDKVEKINLMMTSVKDLSDPEKILVITDFAYFSLPEGFDYWPCPSLSTLKISPDVLSKISEEIMTVCDKWENESTGEIYTTADELREIEEVVALNAVR